MSDSVTSPEPALKPAAQPSAKPQDTPDARALWLTLLDKAGDESGYFETLGARHWALFIDESPTLVVSFEQASDIRARPGQMPLGHDIAAAKGWSHLCLIAEGETFYRDKRVYGYFDRLVDDAFFEDFDQVLFFGADAQAYAAAAFCVAAPGATVIAIAPRATLNPGVAGWDKRNTRARALDFTSRYGYAPDMIDGAGRVFILHDPDIAEDAMHAALFRGPHVTHLRLPHVDGRIEVALTQMHLMQPMVEAALDGSLTPLRFAQLWRARRNYGPYLRGLLTRAEAAGRTWHEKLICRSVTRRLQAPRFRKRLADILAAEAAQQIDGSQ